MIAVSSGATVSNATQFTFFWFQPAIGSTIADLPSLGIDANALYVGVNRFHNVSFSFVAADVHVIRKASLLGAGPIVVTTFVNFADATFAPVGVDNPDVAPTQGYIVAESATGSPALWRVSDPGGAPSLSAQLTVSGGFTSADPTVVPQPGTSTTLSIGRSDLRMASIRNGRLWVTHHVGVNTSGAPLNGSGARTAVRWYEITDLSTTPAVRQSGLIFDSAASNLRHYFIPSLAISGQGHTFFGFNTDGSTEYTNAAASVRGRDDALGTTHTPTLFSASQHAFSLSNGRWGSRSRTVLDADNDMSARTTSAAIQLYLDGLNAGVLGPCATR